MDFDYIVSTIYMLSAPLLVIIAIIGLYQLKLMKDESKINSDNLRLKYKRESILLAQEKIDYYYNSIMKSINQIDSKLLEEPLEILTKSNFKIKDNKIIASVYMGENSFKKLINSSQLQQIIDLINKVEYFSCILFTKTIDEDLVFNMLSNTYTHSLKKYIPLIITLKGEEILTFENTLKLYLRWSYKLDELNLNQRIDKLMHEKNNNYKVSEFKPLGTE